MQDFTKMENEISAYWQSEKTNESNPDKREKFFLNAAFPYPNSPQHIGHARTYTILDAYARYKRLKGKNVLLPMGFHVTGTPILAMAKRLEEKDQELLDIFENIYGISREQAKKLTNPEELVMHFSREIEEGMKLLGLSIDWRRKFYTFDRHFNKFIEWQFLKLRQKGILVQGEHTVAWSKKLDSAVGAHDTKNDIDPEVEEVTAVKFQVDDAYFLCATYRPETIYGVTNIWINKTANYVKAKDKKTGKLYIISEEVFEDLSFQIDLEKISKINAEELLGKNAKNLETDELVPIYDASFVDPNHGTGVVMSVPAHAPYDYVALRDMNKEQAKKVISLEGYDIPAKDVIEKLGIKTQNDEKLEEATKILYKEESNKGIMLFGKYKGKSAKEAKEKIKQDMLTENKALSLSLIANGPVYTRAGDKVIVKKVTNQWFIDYGNAELKSKTLRYAKEELNVIPEEVKQQIVATIEWLNKKACTRAKGLGTKFPFDKNLVIESLSDSTIYMAFYAFSHKIKNYNPEQLDENFFDYLLLGKGKPIDDLHEEMRKEFLYWYPVDSRHTGADLIRNHIPFFILNHVALFEKNLWPKQILINAFVLMDGKKMSKSLGNILPLKKAISEYGADVIRFSVLSGAGLLQDTDFNKGASYGIKEKLEFFKSLSKFSGKSSNDLIDKWLISRLNSKMQNLENNYESFKFRDICLDWFYEMHREMQWYLKRKKGEPALKEFFEIWPVALSPFIPFTSEWLLKKIGKSVAKSAFPEFKQNLIDKNAELSESEVAQLIEDIHSIEKLRGKQASKVFIYIAEQWKYSLFQKAIELKNIETLREYIKQNVEKENLTEAMRLAGDLAKKLQNLGEFPARESLIAYLSDAKAFLSKELSAEIELIQVEKGKNIKHEKAKSALPNKLALVVE